MLRPPVKDPRGNNAMAKEMAMTRSDVRKIAWTLRLVGYGLLMGAAALTFLASSHASASSGARPASPTFARQ
jgi:hypothetical protein